MVDCLIVAQLIAKIGVRNGTPGRRLAPWKWFEVHLDKGNIVKCTCRQAWHKRTRGLVQKFLGTECDHIKALFEGRVYEDEKAFKTSTYRYMYGGAAAAPYRIILSDSYRAEFDARQTALALTADTKGNAT